MKEARPAGFDSATAAAASVAAFLHGRELPPLGKRWASTARPLIVRANRLPVRQRRWIYAAFSGSEGQPASVVSGARWADLSDQLVAQYPRRSYPGAVVGSAPGSAVNLCAALGMPLLPQTQLVPLRRRGVSPDDPHQELEVAAPTGHALVDGEPDVVLHHMIDPSEDRLTLRWFSYFRVKATRLGPAYERFLLDTLEPGATLVVLDCRESWPATRIGDRYHFQFGGVGGATPEEYFHGGPRVRDFLRRYGAERLAWDPPEPDVEGPEAEWGFEPQLADDVERFAAEHGFRVLRLVFDQAGSLSPVVADMYRQWYVELGRPADWLFAESFVLLAPRMALQAGAVPYWLTFSDRPSVQDLVGYLDATEAFDDIDMTLMAHGTESIGVSTPGDWQRVLDRARRRGDLAGVDPRRFPADFGVMVRYRDVLERHRRHPVPSPLSVRWVEEFLATRTGRYSVDVK